MVTFFLTDFGSVKHTSKNKKWHGISRVGWYMRNRVAKQNVKMRIFERGMD